MNTPRLVCALLTAALFASAACGGSSNGDNLPTIPPPVAQWYEGSWKAITADGVAMPATIKARTYSWFTLDLAASSQNFVDVDYTIGQEGPQGGQPQVFACREKVSSKVKGDTVFVTEYDGKTNCPSISLVRYTVVRSGAQLKTTFWDNTVLILQKQ